MTYYTSGLLKHFMYDPPKDRLLRLSLIRVKWEACTRILWAYISSLGSSPVWRYFTILCIHPGSTSVVLHNGITAIEDIA